MIAITRKKIETKPNWRFLALFAFGVLCSNKEIVLLTFFGQKGGLQKRSRTRLKGSKGANDARTLPKLGNAKTDSNSSNASHMT